MKRFRILISSPGDVPEERAIVSFVVEELRRIVGEIREVELEAVRWETHAWPDVGEDAQAVINREIGEFDVFVGVMWRRFGTPTHRADSGTGEEFERAFTTFKKFGRPKIMFYFRTTPFYSKNRAELTQFGKVIRFRKKLEADGVLFWEYDKPIEFERFVREHLIRQILELARETTRTREKTAKSAEAARRRSKPLFVFMSAAREDSHRVLPLYRLLGEVGFRPWLDVQDLLPGQVWARSIEEAIVAADVFLIFLSTSWLGRRGFAHRELSFALDKRNRVKRGVPNIIPVRLDPVQAPLELAAFQWVDLFEADGAERLIDAIKKIADKSTH